MFCARRGTALSAKTCTHNKDPLVHSKSGRIGAQTRAIQDNGSLREALEAGEWARAGHGLCAVLIQPKDLVREHLVQRRDHLVEVAPCGLFRDTKQVAEVVKVEVAPEPHHAQQQRLLPPHLIKRKRNAEVS
jgi:hypothetical protein